MKKLVFAVIVSLILITVGANAATLNLSAGWNFVAVPEQDVTRTPQDLLGSLEHCRTVWGFDNQTKQWLKWIPGVGGTLKMMSFGLGYWIYMEEPEIWQIEPVDDLRPHSIPLIDNPFHISLHLYPGWNLIGYTASQNVSPELFLTFIPSWKLVWSWQGSWFVKSSAAIDNTIPRIDIMEKGKAYWLKVDREFYLDGH